MTRPLIGVTSEMAAAGWGDRVREAVLLPASYALALQQAGSVPVLLPPAPYGATGLTARLDAVLFSDGADIDPRRAGAEPADGAAEPDLVRDAAEFALMRAAIAARLPVLAIGRGMRVLNAVRGGSVADRLPAEADGAARSAASAASAAVGSPAPGQSPASGQSPGSGEPPASGESPGSPGSAASGGLTGPAASAASAGSAARELRIGPGSRLDRVLGQSLTVAAAAWPSGRHQQVDRLGGGLSAVAWTADDTIAAIELTGHPFAIGLAWHPEQGEDLRIFEALREAAAARHQEAA
jgi:putative glutamine amidotransferase